MKKLIYSLIFLVFGISNLFAIDERIIDFYFGNGVWNTRPDAERSQEELRRFINRNLNISTTYSVKLSYNWSESELDDVVETIFQLQQEGKLNVGFFVAAAAMLYTDIG
ncbi:MAG: hypothetical protein LBL65_01525, partial [Campylobacteraceae bacterium]|nr:hypothetical protein [Campylobacteraceae bacterium]